jgi:hypothetical protein
MAERAHQYVERHSWPTIRDAWREVYDGAPDGASAATSNICAWTTPPHIR